MVSWVNSSTGVPPLNSFTSTAAQGSPLCVDVTTGKLYYLYPNNVIGTIGSDFVTPQQFGTVGGPDDTGLIQSAIDSGAPAVFLPPVSGGYHVSSLLMPKGRTNFALFGVRRATRINVLAGAANPALYWDTTANVYDEQIVSDITLIGTNGSQNLVDTTGAGGLAIDGLFVTDVPVGKSAVYVNGAASTYTHDIEITNLEVYSNTAGHSAVRFGPNASDASLNGFEVNGNFQLQYGIYGDSGALTTVVSNGHPYNAANNIVKLAGTNNDWAFDDVRFDNATQDLVRVTSSSGITFTDCYFEAIKSGFSGLYADGTGEGILGINSKFGGGFGAASCVRTGASMNGVVFRSGFIDAANHFTKLFDFNGLRSSADAFSGDTPLGVDYPLSATGSAVQASATEWLGVRNSSTKAAAIYPVPVDSQCTTVYVAVSTTPPGGELFTFQVYGGAAGTTALGSPFTITAGQLSATTTLNLSVSKYDQFVIQSVYTGTVPTAGIVRWSAWFRA